METKDIEKKINEFIELLNDLKNKLDIDSKITKIKELESFSMQEDFWAIKESKEILENIKKLKDIVESYNELNDSLNTIKEMLSLNLNRDFH